MKYQSIIERLPYGQGFLFVDEILDCTTSIIVGTYTFKEDAYFYPHHFPDQPVTPGVMLIECMAQIGLVSLGIYLESGLEESRKESMVLFTDAAVNFSKIVPRGTKVKVEGKKVYHRMGKLKTQCTMWNEEGERVASGTMAGMVKVKNDEK
jgi:3-hydroxyacyl-[acyl-carrier-protein] dehydratase